MDQVHVIIVGGTDADRRRVLKVARLLQDPNEWEGDPPVVGSITAHEFAAEARHQIATLLERGT